MQYFKASLLLFFFIPCIMQAQPKYNSEAMYCFRDYYYINLDNLEKIDIDGVLAKDFKNSSIYASRFKDIKAENRSKTNNIVKDEKEKNVIGKIEIKDGLINIAILNNTWKHKIGNNINSTETILKENILVIAYYHCFSSGSHLRAYDTRTDKLLWEADVKQLNIPHSEYFNKVILSEYKDKIIMEGIEFGGNYVQIFDIKTGKSLIMPCIVISSMSPE